MIFELANLFVLLHARYKDQLKKKEKHFIGRNCSANRQTDDLQSSRGLFSANAFKNLFNLKKNLRSLAIDVLENGLRSVSQLVSQMSAVFVLRANSSFRSYWKQTKQSILLMSSTWRSNVKKRKAGCCKIKEQEALNVSHYSNDTHWLPIGPLRN